MDASKGRSRKHKIRVAYVRKIHVEEDWKSKNDRRKEIGKRISILILIEF